MNIGSQNAPVMRATTLDGCQLIQLESPFLKVNVAPGVGGRVVSLMDKNSGHEFLWRNQALPLQALPAGSEYDPNFYGGIDELLPNDIPEVIDGINCPDHGELWTTPLEWRIQGQRLLLHGRLPLFGLEYTREMILRPDSPWLELNYRLTNLSGQPRHFLWKLHAAMALEAGDVIDCPARTAQVVDPAWSRFKNLTPFAWPMLDNQPVNIMPAPENTTDFFYLYDLKEGWMAWRRPAKGLRFEYRFDLKAFPYCWMFASYGGFNGHYTAILEPCSAMPIAVNEAAAKKQCTVLPPGETLQTQVKIYASRDQSTT